MKTGADILAEVLNATDHTINSLAKAIGLKRSQNLYDIQSGKVKRISAELSEKMVQVFPSLNRTYLLEGEGKLFQEQPQQLATPYLNERRNLKNTVQVDRLIPFYDTEAQAGADMEMNMEGLSRPSGYVDIGDFLRDSTAAMRVYGNSMTPNYPPGTVLGLVPNLDGVIQPGELYVIETMSNRYFKRLYYNDNRSSYVCYSDNTSKFEAGPMAGRHFYEPFEIPLEKVLRVHEVTGAIRRNRNSTIINKTAS